MWCNSQVWVHWVASADAYVGNNRCNYSPIRYQYFTNSLLQNFCNGICFGSICTNWHLVIDIHKIRLAGREKLYFRHESHKYKKGKDQQTEYSHQKIYWS